MGAARASEVVDRCRERVRTWVPADAWTNTAQSCKACCCSLLACREAHRARQGERTQSGYQERVYSHPSSLPVSQRSLTPSIAFAPRQASPYARAARASRQLWQPSSAASPHLLVRQVNLSSSAFAGAQTFTRASPRQLAQLNVQGLYCSP